MAVALCVMLSSAWTRRLEYAADRFSARVTGDPEAMAGALVKIHSQNQVPLSGSPLRELFLSHPWTEKRLQRLGAGLEAAERFPVLDRYTAESGAGGDSTAPLAIFRRGLAHYSSFLLLRIWAVALATGVCAWAARASGAVLGAVFVGGVLMGFFAIPALWSRRMAKVATEVRASLERSHGSFAGQLRGMSPGMGRTVFDSGYYWDIGLARISGPALCYAGDRASFSLPRHAIDRIELSDGPPVRWVRGKAICIHLKSETPECVTLELGPGENRRGVRDLFEALQRWLPNGAAAAEEHCGLPSF